MKVPNSSRLRAELSELRELAEARAQHRAGAEDLGVTLYDPDLVAAQAFERVEAQDISLDAAYHQITSEIAEHARAGAKASRGVTLLLPRKEDPEPDEGVALLMPIRGSIQEQGPFTRLLAATRGQF